MNDFASGVVGDVIRPTTSAASNNLATASKSGAGNAPPLAFKVCHIPNLPNPDYGRELLERVVREFQPIVQRRNYNVVSISELCCCCDGLDFAPGARRKRRKMANNVWGYNQTSFRGGRGKSHTIHLRMRHPTDHARFLPYEDVAGTLAHELSHCEHGPHNDKFYKLMEEILEEHAQLMASGMSFGGAPMQAFGGAGQKLGGPTAATWGAASAAATTNNQNSNNTAVGAFAGKGHTLGGGGGGRGYTLGGDKVFATWMTPAEAAVAAAQARQRVQQLRLRGDHCCRPCTIDTSDDEEEEEGSNDEKNGDIKQPPGDGSEATAQKAATGGNKKRRTNKENLKPAPAKKSNESSNKVVVCIDLTSDGDDDEGNGDDGDLDTKPAATDTKPQQQTSAIAAPWSCCQCTFHNRPMALACEMCATERNNHLRANH